MLVPSNRILLTKRAAKRIAGFFALSEQLGLELKPSNASVETFATDHVEMPSEN